MAGVITVPDNHPAIYEKTQGPLRETLLRQKRKNKDWKCK
jgi:hypothetical protein